MIELDILHDMQHDSSSVKIKVLGIGGAGGNTVNSAVDSDLHGVTYVVANSDVQSLRQSKAYNKVQLGLKATKGLGCGANPEIGRKATEEDLDTIMEYLRDADIVFIVAGMGGGTGSGGAPVVARALKELGILTIAVVTKPFSFEGKHRMEIANQSLELLKKEVDTLIIVPNEKLLNAVDRSVSMIDSFEMINQLLIQSVRSISSIISRSGHINVDFADLRAIMKGMGMAMMGTGSASGLDRAILAAKAAISSNLLENMDIKSARGVLLNICGGADLTLHEINDAANIIYDATNQDAKIILGSVIDLSMKNEVVVSVVATGFNVMAHVDAEKIMLEKAVAALIDVPEQEAKCLAVEPQLVKPLAEKYDLPNYNNLSADSFEIPAYLRKKEFLDDVSDLK